MSWYKSEKKSEWQNKGLYHFVNVMKFEIENYENLLLTKDPYVNVDKIAFYISRNNEREYIFSIRINGDNIDTYVVANPSANESEEYRSLSSDSYDASQADPQQIIETGLSAINDDYSGEFTNGMV